MTFETLKHRFLHKQGHTSQPTAGQNANGLDNDGPHAEVIPRVNGIPKILGLVTDPRYNRDSCGSARFGRRTFWTYRDTQLCDDNGSIQTFPIITSTASWTDYNADGTPVLQSVPPGADPLGSTVLRQYGDNNTDQAYFPILGHGCDPCAGMRDDGTRHAIWPDQPPLVTHTTADEKITAYTWIRKAHIKSDLSAVTQNPATILYRIEFDPSQDHNLPRVNVVHDHFWEENDISFGTYGNLVKDGIAYLYGQVNGKIALAKVSAQNIEDSSMYEYWVNGSWTNRKPSIEDTGIEIPNASAGGQGTYYYSEPWQSFVWIGGCEYPGAEFFISTAPAPTGPWIAPFKFYSGVNGKHMLPAYSIQAHPALRKGSNDNSIYITYTKNDLDEHDATVYTTPLVYVEWA